MILTMPLGLSTAAYYAKQQTEEAAALMSTMPLDCCEVFLETRSEYQPSFVQIVKGALAGLRVHSVHPLGTQFENQLFSPVGRQQQDAMEVFEMVLDAAAMLGAKCTVFHGPFNVTSRRKPFDFCRHAQVIRQLCGLAAQRGLRFGWENVHWSELRLPEHAALLRKLVPELAFVLDIKQAAYAGTSAMAFLPAMGEALVNVHVCDMDDQGKLCLPGRGNVDFVAFFRGLKDQGYGGPVILEPYQELWEEQGEILKALVVLRRAMEQA